MKYTKQLQAARAAHATAKQATAAARAAYRQARDSGAAASRVNALFDDYLTALDEQEDARLAVSRIERDYLPAF